MKTGIIANSDICIPLLQYLKTIQADFSLYAGKPKNKDDLDMLLAFCGNISLPVTIESAPTDLYSWLNEFQPAIVFITGYSSKIDIAAIEKKPAGMYNVHFGKLPRYRGPSPLFWQLKEGQASLYVSIHELAEKLDAGPVVWEKKIDNELWYNYTLVHELFKNMLVEGVHFIMNLIINKMPVPAQPQDEREARYLFRPVLKDVRINWREMDHTEILNLIKACNAWNNGAITSANNTEIKIMDAIKVNKDDHKAIPGTLLSCGEYLTVACANNAILQLNYISVNGIFIAARYAQHFGFRAGIVLQ